MNYSSRLLIVLLPIFCLSSQAKAGTDAKEVPNIVPLRIEEGKVDTSGAFIRSWGLVHNDSSHWVFLPRMYVQLLDKNAKPLVATSISSITRAEVGDRDPRDMAPISGTFIAPGGSSSFHYIRSKSKVNGTYASHTLSAMARPLRRKPHPNMKLEGFKVTPKPIHEVHYSGQLRNAGPSECKSPSIVLALLDSKGKVFKEKRDWPDATHGKWISAGKSVKFKTRMVLSGPLPVGYQVKSWADCFDAR